MDLSIFGLDAKAMADQSTFKISNKGTNVLLLDGDGACYSAASGAMKPDTALRRFERAILEAMFLANCSTARVHLTPSGCFKNGRHLLLGRKPYQQQRKGKKKPTFLEYLRSPDVVEYFDSHSDISVFLQYHLEADDALMQDHYKYTNGIMVSPDKDLLISPYPAYNLEEGKFLTLPNNDKFGYIERKQWLTEAGNPASKLVGKGSKFFMAQLLMGDTADNVAGLVHYHNKPCGEVGAYNVLNPIKDADEAINTIIEAYKFADQNIAPEAEAMWLTRFDGDTALTFISEHDLTDSNLDYINTCYYDRKWKMSAGEYQDTLRT